jgi:hypothetical protein
MVFGPALKYHLSWFGWPLGPMTRIGPGSCRLEISPGSFRGIGPGLWHEPGPMPSQHGTCLSADHRYRFIA